MGPLWLRKVCQYLINCNVIKQIVKGWSCSDGAHCQKHSSYSPFNLEKAQSNQKHFLGYLYSSTTSPIMKQPIFVTGTTYFIRRAHLRFSLMVFAFLSLMVVIVCIHSMCWASAISFSLSCCSVQQESDNHSN